MDGGAADVDMLTARSLFLIIKLQAHIRSFLVRRRYKKQRLSSKLARSMKSGLIAANQSAERVAALLSKTKYQLNADVLRGRIRACLQAGELFSTGLSVLYLLVVFAHIMAEELLTEAAEDCLMLTSSSATTGVGEDEEEAVLEVFMWVDLVFLCFFAMEIALHCAVDGPWQHCSSSLQLLDSLAVCASLVLAIMYAVGAIETNLEIIRVFRLLRLFKVAMAVQRLNLRTRKFNERASEAHSPLPRCNWAHARRFVVDSASASTAVTGLRSCPTPMTPPSPPAKKKFAAFLSHYKLEAGADARYLEMVLEASLGANVFVDSNDLADLSRLFSHGVLRSEVIVLLSSRSVLLRPWCLLELFEARKAGIPVLTLALHGQGLTPKAARASLAELATTLSEGALQQVRSYLAEQQVSWESFVALVGQAVDPRPDEPDTAAGPPFYQVLHTMGSNQQLHAEIQGLVASMALVTHRVLQWEGADDDHDATAAADADEQHHFRLRNLLPACLGGGPAHDEAPVYVAFAPDATSAARLLQSALQPRLGQPVLLSGQWATTYDTLRQRAAEFVQRADGDSSLWRTRRRRRAAASLSAQSVQEANTKAQKLLCDALELGVRQSSTLIVLLTPGLFQCPFTLLELHTALSDDINVVPVMLDGSGYDFDQAPTLVEEFASNLAERDPILYHQIVSLLAGCGVSIGQMLTTMRRLPKLLAVTMNLGDVASNGSARPKLSALQVTKGASFCGSTTASTEDDTTSVTGWSVEGSVASIVAKCKAGQQPRRRRFRMALDVGLSCPSTPRCVWTKGKSGPEPGLEDMNV